MGAFWPAARPRRKGSDRKKGEEQYGADASELGARYDQRLGRLLDQTKPYEARDASAALDDFEATDTAAGSAQTITATLTLDDTTTGSLTAASGNAEAFAAGTGTWAVTGTRADVNAALAAVSFAPVVTDDLSIRDLWMKAHGYV